MTAELARTIEALRTTYPELMMIEEYAKAFRRSRSSAYVDIIRFPELAVRPFGPRGPQRILREVAISRMLRSINP